MESPVKTRFIDHINFMMALHVAISFGMVAIKIEGGYERSGGYFGIIKFAVGIGFVACYLKKVMQEAVNCDGLVSHVGVV